MAILKPDYYNFIYWYNKHKNKECTKDYARQKVFFHQSTWHKLCRDYESGLDVSKYFTRFED